MGHLVTMDIPGWVPIALALLALLLCVHFQITERIHHSYRKTRERHHDSTGEPTRCQECGATMQPAEEDQ